MASLTLCTAKRRSPRTSSLSVEMPISAPIPSDSPSQNIVEALTSTTPESTRATNRSAAAGLRDQQRLRGVAHLGHQTLRVQHDVHRLLEIEAGVQVDVADPFEMLDHRNPRLPAYRFDEPLAAEEDVSPYLEQAVAPAGDTPLAQELPSAISESRLEEPGESDGHGSSADARPA